jgi:hypothetical protein
MIAPEKIILLNKNIQQPKTKHFKELEGSLQKEMLSIHEVIESLNRDDYLDKFSVYYNNSLFIFDIKVEYVEGKLTISDSKASKSFSIEMNTTKEVAEAYVNQRGCFENGLSFGYQAFDIDDKKEDDGYSEAFDNGVLKAEYSFKTNNVYDALIDIFNNLYSKFEESFNEYNLLIEKEKSLTQNDSIFVFDDIITYQFLFEIKQEENAKKIIKTLSIEEDTKYSEIQFSNNISLDDKDSIHFDFYQDKSTFSQLVNDKGYINRILNYLKDFYSVKEFFVIAKNKDSEDYIFYTVDKHNEIEFFVLLTDNNFNEIQIERLSLRNNYINVARFKKSISFKRVINSF